MQHLLFQTLIPILFFSPKVSNAQDLGQLMTAREYIEMKSGPEKTKQIRELEHRSWYHQDALMDHTGNFIESKKFDLSPFVDSLGESAFLVTDISPEFPGGALSLNDYLQNKLGNLLVKPNEETQNTLFVKFSVLKDGKIEAVEPANPFPEWVRSSTRQRCLVAVREMPNWSPGIFKDQPVKVKMLMIFSLRE
ncbi:MAG: hypothetical protein H7246_21000 [Phycisphaerae bacterium]|nr:hypothetical protein [Saprospiraceae bacterium]